MSGIKARALELISAAKSGEPILNLKRSVDAETLWPAAVEKESDKAATILRSFFVDGFIVPYRTVASCPEEILKRCQALMILHLMKSDLCSPHASGSGVVIARLPDGKWSEAAGVLVDFHADLPTDVDVADVVLVVNDKYSVGILSRDDCILGKSLRIAPGPILKSDAGTESSYLTDSTDVPAWVYAKSKGQILDLDLSGLIVREALSENERAYGVAGISTREMMSGTVKGPARSTNYLFDTVSALESQSGDYSRLLAPGSCTSDRRIRPVKMATKDHGT